MSMRYVECLAGAGTALLAVGASERIAKALAGTINRPYGTRLSTGEMRFDPSKLLIALRCTCKLPKRLLVDLAHCGQRQ